MRLGIQFHDKVVQGANDRIVACCERVQLRIFERVVALAHGALDVHHAMAHEAAQSRLRGRRFIDFAGGRVEHAAEKQRWVVASRAPS